MGVGEGGGEDRRAGKWGLWNADCGWKRKRRVIGYRLLVISGRGGRKSCRLSVVCWPWKKSKVGRSESADSSLVCLRPWRCSASISGKLPPPAKPARILFKATCPDFRWFSGPGRDARAAGRMGGTPAGGAVPRGLGRAKPVKIKSRPGGDREEWNRVLKRSLPHTTGAGEIRTQLVTSFLTMERASSIPPKLW